MDLLIIELTVNGVLTVDQEAENSIRLEAGLGVLVGWVESTGLKGHDHIVGYFASNLSHLKVA